MTTPHLLVTGGSGFIGSHFVRHMVTSHPDYRITVLDKLTYAGTYENLRTVERHPGFRFIHGDICDAALVQTIIADCDWVVHFAAESHVDRSIINPAPFIQTNVQGTLVLLEAARNAHLRLFVYISTDEVYGEAEAPDGTRRPSVETDPHLPHSPYAATKSSADLLASSYWEKYGLPIVITRGSNTYGPHQYPEKQLPIFILNALHGKPLPVHGTGQHIRDWLFVGDHCAALDLILHAQGEQMHGQVYNIGAREERSTLQNAQIVLDLLGQPHSLITCIPDRPGNVHYHAVDTTRLQHDLGWQPTISFEQGLRHTIAWYQTHQEWLARILARRDALVVQALGLRELV